MDLPPKRRLGEGKSTTIGKEANKRKDELQSKKNPHREDVSTMVQQFKSPVQSPNDKREYRVIQLQNKLTALLISDVHAVGEHSEDEDQEMHPSSEEETESESESDTGSDGGSEAAATDAEDDDGHKGASNKKQGEKMAAAGLCIGVGSFSDPDDIPGLAHFLEHMVFMGSEKYPDENSFDAFIKRHGGSDNASTDCERTVFQFEIQEKHFHEGLDRFAQFFVHPLLKPDSMDRELESVDSEFQTSLPSDTFRKQQLFGSLARLGHPMKKFMWGNVSTLKELPQQKNLDVHSRLQEFRKCYYTAQFMTLAVQARESLDVLQSWVTEIFSDIPKNHLPALTFSHMKDPFNTQAFYKLYKVIPVKNSHQVEISWALPSMVDMYLEKPLHYYSYLIGHEGMGSIISFLKKKVWALSLHAGNAETGIEHNSTFSWFKIGVGLTDDGLTNVFDVITAIFEYVEMLRIAGPQERVFDEIQMISENNFRWQEEVNSVDYVENLSENMQLFPPEHYITGDELLFKYDAEVLRNCINHLVPDKCNITVSSKTFEKKNICDKIEPWFQTPYSESDIPQEWLNSWRDLKLNDAFHLPEVNKFIATDFAIKNPDSPISEFPVKILDDDQSRMFYKKDSQFNVPKACTYVLLISPIVQCSPQNSMMLDLFASILSQNLMEAVYPALCAQLSFDVLADEMGLAIQVNGFNQKLLLLFEMIMDYVKEFDVEDDMFNAIKNHTHKQYYNRFIKPGQLCKDVRLSILQQVHWMPIDKIAAVKSATKEMLLNFVSDFKRQLFIESLVQGNMTAAEAIELDGLIRTKLGCGKVPFNLMPEGRVVQLPTGESFFRAVSFNKEDGNSVVTNYYQSGPADIHKVCLMQLLLMFMEEPCFDILRTREQLGYNVSCLCRTTFGILGFSVTVHTQADKFSCTFVDERIDEFLKLFKTTMDNAKEKEFQNQVTALIKLKECVDLHLKEEVDRNWSEIFVKEYVFDRLEKEIQCLKNITLPELRSWCNQHIAGSNLRKLGVQIIGPGRMHENLTESTMKRLQKFLATQVPMQQLGPCINEGEGEHQPDVIHQTIGSNLKADNKLEDATPVIEDEEDVYQLQCLPNPDTKRFCQIVNDIQEYKNSLMIYPVTRIVS